MLVVDDEPHIGRIIRTRLEQDGLDVLLAEDGPSALAMLAASPHVGVIVLDLMLPGMSGYEVCRRLRGAGMANVPMIALSGYVRDDADDDAALFDAWMVKPAPYGEVLQTLRTVMPSREVDHH